MGPYLLLIRPKQWIKNAFLFAPLIFARELFNPGAVLAEVKAFVAFCLTASCIYIVNDIADVQADRLHPVKKSRPLAAGTISTGGAVAFAIVLLIADILLIRDLPSRFVAAAASYFLINLAYSFKLKDVLLLDVFTIAAGFMLRVLAGAYAINVQVSSWIVLCTLFVSLFLGFAKRRGELVQLQGQPSERKVLHVYRIDLIDQMLTIAAAGAVISYALYTVAPRTVETYGTDRMIYTTVFVIYGVFRYLYLVHTTPATENPTNALTSDLPILVTGTLWILSCIGLIYSRGRIPWLGL